MEDDEISGACRTHVEMRNSYKTLVGKLDGKRLIGRTKHRS
jgi:hypothetical protein